MKARTKGSILMASAVVALIGSGAAVTGSGDGEQWKRALEARSEALNEQYGHGMYAPVTESSWMRALRLRSDALNGQHGLGEWEFRTSAAALANGPAWLRALRLRSEALNERYKIGERSPRS